MRVVVGLGANLGDRLVSLRAAATRVGALGRELARSKVYETEPVGPPQPRYLNAAIAIETTLAPEALMDALLELERAMGRVRSHKNSPRTIDLDILWIDGVVRDTEALTVPHPRLLERAFALGPLRDVAPDAFPRAAFDASALRMVADL